MAQPTPSNEARRRHLERQASVLFLAASLVMAIICGAIIISGWFAGVIQDRYERVFWFGAVLALASVLVLLAAVIPGPADDDRASRRIVRLLRIGCVGFGIAPVLCIGALVLDFYA